MSTHAPRPASPRVMGPMKSRASDDKRQESALRADMRRHAHVATTCRTPNGGVRPTGEFVALHHTLSPPQHVEPALGILGCSHEGAYFRVG